MQSDGFHEAPENETSPDETSLVDISPTEGAHAKRAARYVGYVGVILIPFVSFLLGLTVGYSQAKQDVVSWYGPSSGSVLGDVATQMGSVSPKIDLGVFWETLGKVESLYIDPDKVDYNEMGMGAIRGMVAALGDQYTSFMSPEETVEFQDSLNGDLQGIGAELALRDGHVVVVAPIKGAPAEKAGVKAGDIIFKVDGQSVANLSLTEVVHKIRGQPGTTVVLTLIRGEDDEQVEVSIERQAIKVPSVELVMLEGNTAHVMVSQFGTETTREFSKVVNQLLIKKPSGVVVDLRNNGGGYLDAAIELAGEFIDEGVITIVRKRGQDGTWSEHIERADGRARLKNVPLVVLVNEGSASASEIFAGAVRDHDRARLVGQKTFGKGTVQDLVDLSNGSSLRITTAKWFTPNNLSIHQTGIEPDVGVKLDPEQKEKDGTIKDLQLQKAVEVLKNKGDNTMGPLTR